MRGSSRARSGVSAAFPDPLTQTTINRLPPETPKSPSACSPALPYPIPVKISRMGTSHGIIVPKVLTRYFGWAPGMRVSLVLRTGGKRYERELISLGAGHSVGVILPIAILEAEGAKQGSTVKIPFHEWRLVA